MVFPRVAVLPGSIRSASLNQQLAAALIPLFSSHEVETALVDLGDYPMPLYNGDDEAEHGQPATAVALRDRLAAFDGLIFVTPEYNGGPSALLKNSIDWVSRVDRAVFKPLLIGLAAASPGPRGGANALSVMRIIVEPLRLEIVADDLSIGHAADAFELIDGVVTLVRADHTESANGFVSGFAARLLERSAVDSSR